MQHNHALRRRLCAALLALAMVGLHPAASCAQSIEITATLVNQGIGPNGAEGDEYKEYDEIKIWYTLLLPQFTGYYALSFRHDWTGTVYNVLMGSAGPYNGEVDFNNFAPWFTTMPVVYYGYLTLWFEPGSTFLSGTGSQYRYQNYYYSITANLSRISVTPNQLVDTDYVETVTLWRHRTDPFYLMTWNDQPSNGP